MAKRVPALIQPVDARPAGLLLSDPQVAAQLVNTRMKSKSLRPNKQRDIGRRMWMAGLGRVYREWDGQQKIG